MPATISRNPQLLNRIVATIGELPTSPAVVSAVMGLTADLNTEIDKLSRVLADDPALTAKVLRLSNSPFYGRSRSVGSLHEAILILGFYTIRSLVVASSTYSLFGRKTENDTARTLWDHSLATAIAARVLIGHMRSRFVEEAFIIGLLHDIGKLILHQKMTAPYHEIITRVRRRREEFAAVEQEQLGFTHGELGAIILARWNFPPLLVDAIRFHHTPESCGLPTDGGVPLAHVVCFADAMVKHMGYGFVEGYTVDLASLPQAAMLRLTPEAIETLRAELEIHYHEEKHLFEE